MTKMSFVELKSLFPKWEEDINHGIDRRTNKATNKHHIHKYNPVWLSSTPPRTHAWYRRNHVPIPSRKVGAK
jgi:hypothetical protein